MRVLLDDNGVDPVAGELATLKREHANLRLRVAEDQRRAEAHVGEADDLRTHNRILDAEIAALHEAAGDATTAVELLRAKLEAELLREHAEQRDAMKGLLDRVHGLEAYIAVNGLPVPAE